MKKFSLFALALFMFGASLLLFSGDAFAMQCKDGQSLNSDECWTEVKIQSGYLASLGVSVASQGRIVVVSNHANSVADNDGFLARFSTASTGQLILGVIQKPISSGDSGLVLARGRGYVRVAGVTASNAVLAVTEGTTLSSRAALAVTSDGANNDRSYVGLTLSNETTGGELVEAYIDTL